MTTEQRQKDDDKQMHLLIKGVFRVWCRPRFNILASMNFTTVPSQATCLNCLTQYRGNKTGNFNRVPSGAAHPSRKSTHWHDQMEREIAKRQKEERSVKHDAL